MIETGNLVDFKSIAKNQKGSMLEGAYKVIADSQIDSDGYVIMNDKGMSSIQDSLVTAQKKNLSKNGGYKTLKDCRESAKNDLRIRFERVTDSFGKDLGFYYNGAELGFNRQPAFLSPSEATALYYNGSSLPSNIIDKKASAIFLNGMSFKCKGIDNEKMVDFADYVKASGFSDQCATAVTQSLVYGGALMYPIFSFDNPYSMLDSFDWTQPGSVALFLKLEGMPNKDFVREFAVIDRWNTLIVPEYSPMAKDYLEIGAMFIPVDGVTISMSRASMIRWRKMSYWSALRYLGWCPSDISGWIESYLQYSMMQAVLPKMAMQSSLMYSHTPIDAVLMQNGTADVEELQKMAQEALDKLDVANAKVFNSIGELKTIERTFSGYIDIFKEKRATFCADVGLPVSVIFEDAPTGLADDRKEDITLKKSETVKRIWNAVQPEITKQMRILAYSYFGADSEEAKHLKNLVVEANPPVAESTQQKATIANSLAQSVQMMSNAGMSPSDAIDILSGFFPTMPVSDALKEKISTTFIDNRDARGANNPERRIGGGDINEPRR